MSGVVICQLYDLGDIDPAEGPRPLGSFLSPESGPPQPGWLIWLQETDATWKVVAPYLSVRDPARPSEHVELLVVRAKNPFDLHEAVNPNDFL